MTGPLEATSPSQIPGHVVTNSRTMQCKSSQNTLLGQVMAPKKRKSDASSGAPKGKAGRKAGDALPASTLALPHMKLYEEWACLRRECFRSSCMRQG